MFNSKWKTFLPNTLTYRQAFNLIWPFNIVHLLCSPVRFKALYAKDLSLLNYKNQKSSRINEMHRLGVRKTLHSILFMLTLDTQFSNISIFVSLIQEKKYPIILLLCETSRLYFGTFYCFEAILVMNPQRHFKHVTAVMASGLFVLAEKTGAHQTREEEFMLDILRFKAESVNIIPLKHYL